MEVIVLENKAYQELFTKIENLEKYFKHIVDKQPLSEAWLDIEETCELLKVSKRTLQNYRDDGILTYSQVGGKVYFSSTAIEEHLKNHTRKAFRKPENYI
jgi:excisionase family DNA binding protein